MSDSEPDARYVVLVDVIESRTIQDRSAFEEQLASAMEYVNDAESESISTPLTQMKGIDEFGCVLTRVSPLPDIISDVLDRIHPTFARFAIARGEIDIGPGNRTVARMDGPAFHRASELLNGIDDSGLYAGVDTGREIDDLLTAALNLLILSRDGLTDRQVEIILAYERHGTQSEAATELGLRQQAVSKSLRRANYMTRSEIRSRLRRTLEEIYD